MGRPKSVFSIWNKMQTKKVSFEEVMTCSRFGSSWTPTRRTRRQTSGERGAHGHDFYQRTRTVCALDQPTQGQWLRVFAHHRDVSDRQVGVQIRSRMDDMAKGLAAHWRYKADGGSLNDHRPVLPMRRSPGGQGGDNIDSWLGQIWNEGGEADALSFIDEFKLNLFSKRCTSSPPTGN